METRLSAKMILFLMVVFYLAVPYQLNWTVSLIEEDRVHDLLTGATNINRQVSIFLFAAVSGYLMFKEKLGELPASVELRYAILSFICLALASILWSEDKLLTVKRLAVFVSIWLAAFSISRRYSFADVALIGIHLSAFTLLISLCCEILFGTFTPWGGEYRFAGVVHPNSQGLNCALLLLSSLGYLMVKRNLARRGKIVAWCCLLLALVFLILTKSRTALFSTVGAVYFATVLYNVVQARRPGTALLSLVIIPCQLAALYFLLDINLSTRIPDAIMLGRDTDVSSLTGRTELWRDLMEYAVEKPLLGYGYDSFWTVDHTLELMDREGTWVSSDHSSYFNIALGMGLVGLACFIVMLALSLYRSISTYVRTARSEYLFTTAIMVLAVINMFTETILYQFNPITLIILVALLKIAYAGAADDPLTLEAEQYERES